MQIENFLEKAAASVRQEVSARHFDRVWATVYRLIANIFTHEHNTFERGEDCDKLDDDRAHMMSARAQFHAAGEQRYTRVEALARGTLVQRIKDVLWGVQSLPMQAPPTPEELECEKLEQQHRQAQTVVDRHLQLREAAKRVYYKRVIAMTGDETIIPKKAKKAGWQEVLIIAAIAGLVMYAENILGYVVWAFKMHPAVARIVSIATVLFVTIGFGFTARKMKPVIANFDARRHFRKRFPKGAPEGVRVDPLDLSDKILAWGSLAGSIVVANLLFWSRLWIAGSMEMGQSVGVVVILLLGIGFAVFEYVRSAKGYSDEQYAALDEALYELENAEDELEDAETQLANLPPLPVKTAKADPTAGLTPEERKLYFVREACSQYEQTMEAEETRLRRDAEQLESERKQVLARVRLYLDAVHAFVLKFQLSLDWAVAYLVRTHNLEGDQIPKQQELDEQVASFANGLKRGHVDEQFLRELRETRFTFTPPAGVRLADFPQFVSEMAKRFAIPSSTPYVAPTAAGDRSLTTRLREDVIDGDVVEENR